MPPCIVSSVTLASSDDGVSTVIPPLTVLNFMSPSRERAPIRAVMLPLTVDALTGPALVVTRTLPLTVFAVTWPEASLTRDHR